MELFYHVAFFQNMPFDIEGKCFLGAPYTAVYPVV